MTDISFDMGLIVGTGVFMLFGFFFAFVLPAIMTRSDGVTDDTRRLAKWLRWLGLTLVILSVLAAIAIKFLPKAPY